MTLFTGIVSLVWWTVFVYIGSQQKPIQSVQWSITIFLYAPLMFIPHMRWFVEERICGANRLWYTKCWMSLYSVAIALLTVMLQRIPTFPAAAGAISLCCAGMWSFSRMDIQHWPMTTMLAAIFLNTLYPIIVILALFTVAIWFFPHFAGIQKQTVALTSARSRGSSIWNWVQSGPFLIWNRNGGAMFNQIFIQNSARDTYNLGLLLIVAFITACLMAVSTKGKMPDMDIVGIICFVCMLATVTIYIAISRRDKADSLFRTTALSIFLITATSNVDISALQTAWLRAGDQCIPGKSPTDYTVVGMTYMATGSAFTLTALLFRHYYQKMNWNHTVRSMVIWANTLTILFGLLQISAPTNEAFIFVARSIVNPISFAILATAWCYLTIDACPANTRTRYTVESFFSLYVLGLVAGSWLSCLLIDAFALRGANSINGCDFYHYKHLILTANCLFPWISIAMAYALVPNIEIINLINLQQ